MVYKKRFYDPAIEVTASISQAGGLGFLYQHCGIANNLLIQLNWRLMSTCVLYYHLSNVFFGFVILILMPSIVYIIFLLSSFFIF